MEMNTWEFRFISDLKDKVVKVIKLDELYQQKDLLEILDISINSFRKYFSSDKEWTKNAMLVYGTKKFFKGYEIRLRVMDLLYKSWSVNFDRDMEQVYKILEPYKDKVDVRVTPFEQFEYEEIQHNVFTKFEGFGTDEEKNYWAKKLEEKK